MPLTVAALFFFGVKEVNVTVLSIHEMQAQQHQRSEQFLVRHRTDHNEVGDTV